MNMKENTFINKLKAHWGVTSFWQVIIIFIVFAITGSTAAAISTPILHVFGVTESTSLWIKVPVYVAVILPAYQILLLGFGTLAGQFRFFWNFEKRTIGRLIPLPRKKKAN